jgi:hypothetical protein
MPLSHLVMLLPPLAVNLLALGVGFHRRGRLGPPLRLLLAYLLLCMITTAGMVVLAFTHGNNWVLVHLFAPVQLLVFAWMYAEWAPAWMGVLFKLTALGYALACLWLLPREDLSRFSGFSFHLQTLLLLTSSLMLLCHLALKVDRALLEHPGAWIAAGILCDMAITLVAYASRGWLLVHAPSWAFWLNLVRSQVVTLSYLFFLRALTLETAACGAKT